MPHQKQKWIISLGGSLINPEGKPDIDFLKRFRELILGYIDTYSFLLVCGGGRVTRTYQAAARELGVQDSTDLDWIGIRPTHTNAELVRAMFGDHAPDSILIDPTVFEELAYPVTVFGGWKPGWSTDMDAVLAAETFGAKQMINLSNIDYIYSDDPKKNPNAEKIEKLTWSKLQDMIGTEWTPGLNSPFDPKAIGKAKDLGLTVYFAPGAKLENLENILNNKDFEGSTVAPT